MATFSLLSACLGSSGGGNPQSGSRNVFVDQSNSSGEADGTEQFPWVDIESALANSKKGDRIFVRPGTYHGNHTIKADVDLIGAGASNTIIDGAGGDGLCIIVNYGIGSETEISGFTFTNVAGNGAVFLRGGPNLHDCAIIKTVPPTGDTTDPFNDDVVQPAALYMDKPIAMTIRGCIIVDNSKTGITVFFPLQLIQFEGCLIACNAGHGINLDGLPNKTETEVRFTNCTIANNLYNGIRLRKYSNVEMINCTFFGNADIAVYETINAGDPILRFCDVVGGYHDADLDKDLFKAGQINALDPPGLNEANVVTDPEFKDTSEPGLRFGLRDSSPLLHTGDPDPLYNNRDGSRSDVGATGGPSAPTDPLACEGGAFLGGHLHRWPVHGTDPRLEISADELDTSADLPQDFDGDGRADQLVLREHPFRLELARSRAINSLVTPIAGPLELGLVHVLDIDLDGSLDVHVQGGGSTGDDLLLLNDGRGGFSQRAALLGLHEDTSALTASWCDADGDGDPDLVLTAGDGSHVLYENRLASRPGALLSMLLPQAANLVLKGADESGNPWFLQRTVNPGANVLLGWRGASSVEAWLVAGDVSRRLTLTRGVTDTIGP